MSGVVIPTHGQGGGGCGCSLVLILFAVLTLLAGLPSDSAPEARPAEAVTR